MGDISFFPERRQRALLSEFKTFTPASWQDKTPPAYDWMVEGAALSNTVSLISGDGGLGKSLLMQQLCTAAALGSSWLGMNVKRCKTFFLGCEDDADELWRRQERINKYYRCDMGDLDDMLMVSRAGEENSLFEFDRRTDWGEPTAVMEQLSYTVRQHGAQLVIIDTVADAFGGNEIVRSQVRRFITALRKFAISIQGTVILTAHPSNEGLTSGSGISGNRAWSNSVRSRLYLTRDTFKSGNQTVDGDPDIRWLKTMKSNYGPNGGKLKLRWQRGVFMLADEPRMYRDFTEASQDDNIPW